MKKTISIISAIAAGAAMLLSSCTKQEMPESKTELTYNFSIGEKDSYGADTKAAKTGWTEGDKIYILFDNAFPESIGYSSHYSLPDGFMVITYDGSKWTVTQEPSTAPTKENGTVQALYYDLPTGVDVAYGYSTNGGNMFTGYTSSTNEYSNFYTMFLIDNTATYTKSGSTVTITINNLGFYNDTNNRPSVQICVTGLPAGSSWQMQFPSIVNSSYSEFNMFKPILKYDSNTGLNTGFEGNVYEASSTQNFKYDLIERTDGQYFYGNYCDKSKTGSQTYSVTLISTTYGTWKKTFENKTFVASDASKGAITFTGPSNPTGSETAGTVNNGWTKQ